MKTKILVVGRSECGKTTFTSDLILNLKYNGIVASYEDSSEAAYYEAVKPHLMKMGFVYGSYEEAKANIEGKRHLWVEAIANYNRKDKSRLARKILSESDIYVGMRSQEEYDASAGLFDIVVRIYDNFTDMSEKVVMPASDAEVFGVFRKAPDHDNRGAIDMLTNIIMMREMDSE